MKKPTIVTCPCCKGTGKAPIGLVMQQTLDAVPKNRFASTSEIEARVADQFVKKTAINNRLANYLLHRGLVECHRRGKSLFWRRIR